MPEEKQPTPNLDTLDILMGIGKGLSDEQKYSLLKSKGHPPESYKFPQVVLYGRPRSFLRKWLAGYPWLFYSMSKDGAYCKICVLFAVETPRVNQLVKKPLIELEKGNAVCRDHALKGYHAFVIEEGSKFYSHILEPGRGHYI